MSDHDNHGNGDCAVCSATERAEKAEGIRNIAMTCARAAQDDRDAVTARLADAVRLCEFGRKWTAHKWLERRVALYRVLRAAEGKP